MKRERLSQAEILGWSVVGFGAGLLGGLVAAGWAGRVTRGRLGDAIQALGTPGRPLRDGPGRARSPAPISPSRTSLAYRLSAVAVSHGTVELRGWVPDRRTRALAVRKANGVPGLEAVINSILVRGEDDLAGASDLTLADQSA